MTTKINNRFKSNRGDANSVSQILWIAIAAAVISVVGLAIFNAIKYSGMSSGARVESLDCLLEKGKPCISIPDDPYGFVCDDWERTGNYYVPTEQYEKELQKQVKEAKEMGADGIRLQGEVCYRVDIDRNKGDKLVFKPGSGVY